MRPAVFIDRDDTLIECRSVTTDGDLGDPGLVRLKPGAAEACRRLRDAGYVLVVITNQGGVARGRYTLRDVERVNQRVDDLLDGLIDAFRVCPYHPEGLVPEYRAEHPWRKPAPGMLLDAAAELGIDLGVSWVIGDSLRDCQAGRAAGCRGSILVAPAGDREAAGDPAVSCVARSLPEAAQTVLKAGGVSAEEGRV